MKKNWRGNEQPGEAPKQETMLRMRESSRPYKRTREEIFSRMEEAKGTRPLPGMFQKSHAVGEKRGMKPKFNEAHTLLEKHLRELHFCFVREAKFHDTRKWRLDYVIYREAGPSKMESTGIAVEIEGGIGYFINPRGGITRGGRHSRQKGYQADLDKYNAATMMGYRVLRFSTHDVVTGRAKAFLAEHLR